MNALNPLDGSTTTRSNIEHWTPPLPERFVLVVRDDSMTATTRRGLEPGDRAIFQPSPTALPGQDVLVADREDNLYIRTYDKRRPGHWVAVARNPAYQPLDSLTDGLRIVAILKGHEWD